MQTSHSTPTTAKKWWSRKHRWTANKGTASCDAKLPYKYDSVTHNNSIRGELQWRRPLLKGSIYSDCQSQVLNSSSQTQLWAPDRSTLFLRAATDTQLLLKMNSGCRRSQVAQLSKSQVCFPWQPQKQMETSSTPRASMKLSWLFHREQQHQGDFKWLWISCGKVSIIMLNRRLQNYRQ